MVSHPKLVGIYTRPSDDHLERVVAALNKRQLAVVCFDSADFPQSLRLCARLTPGQAQWHGDFLYQGESYRLEDFRSIWYRRPSGTYRFVSGLSETGYEYARAEAHKGFEGVLRALACLWISDPDAIRAAEWKPKQLSYAEHVGLRIPRTLITYDGQAALQFFDECQGKIAYKPLSQGVPRPKAGEEWQGAIYTTRVTRAALQEHLAAIEVTATCFQEYIEKHFEVRVNVIGEHVFAAEIQSQHSERARVDFRLGYADLRYAIHTLPAVVEEACRRLVRLFGLQFAAIDLLVTAEGEYVFVDLNANGQWGWIENHTGLPLTETLVDLLARGRRDPEEQKA
jgi:glutathione synthase/RimK-type ligase-like ATP-grasp enzyme